MLSSGTTDISVSQYFSCKKEVKTINYNQQKVLAQILVLAAYH